MHPSLASEDRVVLRAAGRNYRYATMDIPHKVVTTLADRWFTDGPVKRVLIGTYHAVDRHGDLDQARRLWEQAGREGLDVTDLMPELDVAAAERQSRDPPEP